MIDGILIGALVALIFAQYLLYRRTDLLLDLLSEETEARQRDDDILAYNHSELIGVLDLEEIRPQLH